MLTNLKIKNIRKFNNKELDFDKKIVLLTGFNGTGKTTILESIFFASTSKSFKTSNWKEMITKENDYSSINATFIKNEFKNVININISDRKDIKINNNKAKISELISINMPLLIRGKTIVLFKGDKYERLKFIDKLISAQTRVFSSLINDFNKVKTMLKKFKEGFKTDDVYLDVLMEQLTDIQIEIINRRRKFTNQIIPIFEKNTNKYLGKSLRLVYKNIQEPDDIYKNLLKNSFVTVSRDDFDIYYKNDSYIKYASDGEIRIAFILLAISHIEIMRKDFNQDFLLLLDDIFSELDEKNINKLIDILIKKEIDSFITTPSMNSITLQNAQKIQEIKL